MRKIIFIVIALLLFACAVFIYLNNRPSTVIAVHQLGNTSIILVDHLPVTNSAKIQWWYSHIDSITERYHLVADRPEGMFFYAVYAFDKGYQKEGKEDRLCFDEMTPPENCVDKNILLQMMPWGNGEDKFYFGSATYMANKNGDIRRVYDPVTIVEPDEK